MAQKWKDLEPDEGMLWALDQAGERPETGSSLKRNWGSRFADACAVLVANALRAQPTVGRLEIRPLADGTGRESLTGVAGHGMKKVDVIASTLASGLQVAVSLKAENFPSSEGNYGKNLTNRLYELQDEVRAIHEYQPRAYVVGIFYLPVQAAFDRQQMSSFARAVGKLRARTGRLDRVLSTQLNKLDLSLIGLYQADDDASGIPRGVVRYFDTLYPPPERGRPQLDTTLSLDDVAGWIEKQYREEGGEILDFADPESND